MPFLLYLYANSPQGECVALEERSF